jgi:hypothetical protein
MMRLLLALLLVSVGVSSAYEIVVTEEEIQTALEEAIVDTRVSDLEVEIQPGLITLTALRTMPLQTYDIEIQIWLDPHEDDNVWAVKEATANGIPFGQARIDLWNAWFNAGMEAMAQTAAGRADRITIETDQVVFEWE